MQDTLKRTILVLLATGALVATATPAARADDLHDDVSVGYELDRFQNDFGVGLNVTSPHFAGGYLAVQAAVVRSWVDALAPGATEQNWYPYTAYKLGLVATRPLTGQFRTYAVGGVSLFSPNKDLSEKSQVVGGYGAFGFEFVAGGPITYYIEMGGIGSGAHAEKAAGKPLYGNGFLETVGFRWYL